MKDKIYFHFDIDVLDPKEINTAMCLADHGLSKKTLLKLIDFLKNNKQIVGMGMTEFSGQDKLI